LKSLTSALLSITRTGRHRGDGFLCFIKSLKRRKLIQLSCWFSIYMIMYTQLCVRSFLIHPTPFFSSNFLFFLKPFLMVPLQLISLLQVDSFQHSLFKALLSCWPALTPYSITPPTLCRSLFPPVRLSDIKSEGGAYS